MAENEHHMNLSVKDLHASAFISADESVINHRGDNFYRACGELVVEEPGGTKSHCVKRWGHPGHIHEDYDGVQVSEWSFSLEGMSVEHAIRRVIGEASTLGLSGTVNYERKEFISTLLIAKIRELTIPIEPVPVEPDL